MSVNWAVLNLGLPTRLWHFALVCFVGLAVAGLYSKGSRGSVERHAPWLATLLAGASALLSLGYFYEYLGGAPRVIDATAYLLEARIFESGAFTFQPPEPWTLFRGRFLLSPPQDPGSIGVIFPPGYPALLGLGEAIFSYKIVGPLLAFGLTRFTFTLATLAGATRERALGATLLSTLSATLHYHTADTMSHGWSGLLVLLGSCLYLRAHKQRDAWGAWLGIGICLGLLIATRQLTGLLFAATLLTHSAFFVPHAEQRARFRLVRDSWLVALGAAPGLALLLLHQKALTGSYLSSPQLAYYATSDGPAGCFGLGLGKGCEFEHGDFYRATGGAGLRVSDAALTTLRRLRHHSLDIANFEPILALVALAWWKEKSRALAQLAGIFGMLLVVGYAAFYFDGSYLGGGARFFFELLPLEHALLAVALPRWIAALPLLATLGFVFHARVSHERLSAALGGAPYLLESEINGLPRNSILFVQSDHALLLGLRPPFGESAPLVARRSYDERERWLSERTGRARVFELLPSRARAAETGNATTPASRIRTLGSPSPTATVALEAETLWPALSQRGGWIHPSFPADNCSGNGKGLKVHASGPNPSFRLWVDAPRTGLYSVEFFVVQEGVSCVLHFGGVWPLPGPVEFRPPNDGNATFTLDQLHLTPVEAK